FWLGRTPFSQTSATDQYTHVASEMALVHNCLIRAFNSIYIQAPHVPASEHKSFVAYCLAAHAGLASHHRGEEAYFFPEIERKSGEEGVMEVNVAQHKAFKNRFGAWGQWLQSVEQGREKFSSDKCRALMDGFIAPLAQHLTEEIASLLSLSKFGDKVDLRALSKVDGDNVMGSLSKTRQLPVFFVNHDTTFEGGVHHFPPIPVPVSWVLRNGFCRWNAAWWKFGTCGYDGKPRGLRYTETEQQFRTW
ncbi:hypothetical protein BS50DRAFT_479999, partial [Corynespora cassiicola Philippines]